MQSGGTLGGVGGVTNVTVNVGGAIAPGVAGTIGFLTVSNNATLLGNANMDVNKATITTYYVLATNNVAAPLATWPRIATNNFDASGNFSASIPTAAGDNRFFTIQAP